MPTPVITDACSSPVAVFDSGVGGLTVLHELLVHLPAEDFLYLGDTARFPYGDRDAAELERFGLQIASELLRRGSKMLVVACNSLTAAALPAIERSIRELSLPIDVIGVVKPEALQAVSLTRSGSIGLLATQATVASGAYERAVADADPHTTLTSVACPQLAPMIQSGALFDEVLVEKVREYCAPLRAAAVDTVILGCTHFPLVRPLLQRILGRGVTIVSSGAAAARQVEHALRLRGIERAGDSGNQEGFYSFLCTGEAESFRALGTRFLQMPLGDVRQIELGDPDF
jgi:glutamate racemase